MSCSLMQEERTEPSQQLNRHLLSLISNLSIPSVAKRIAINFRRSEYYVSRQGCHPVEIQLEKQSSGWEIVFVASFSYPDEQADNVEVELYFNFLRGWFYQPDIEQCELHQQKVIDLYQSWESTLLHQLHQQAFDQVTASLVSSHTPPNIKEGYHHA